ncbi:MAG: permease-like cell division protein FtsX [Marinifilaceae bacterium]
MKQKKSKGVRGSYFASTISISLVLFLVGAMVFLLLNAREISNYVKENIGISIIIKDDAKLVDVKLLQKTLETKNFVKKTSFITKADAASDFEKQVGTDFVKFLGFNPLLASIELKLNANFTSAKTIGKIEKNLRKFDVVQDVYYQKSLVTAVNENVRKISIVLLAASVLMLLISFTLIRNTIHLSIYSQRFIINTMQLVGAKSSFIRRPFVLKSMFLGVVSALLANVLLMGLVYFAFEQLAGIVDLIKMEVLLQMFLLVIFLGVVITWISTTFAVNKYLRKNINDLYA